MVARLLLGDLRLEKGLLTTRRCPGRALARIAPEQVVGPASSARLDQRRGDADVGGAFALAVVDGAHAVTDFEPDVPQERQEALECRP